MKLKGSMFRIPYGVVVTAVLLVCSLAFGISAAFTEPGDPSDEVLLSATPISRARMELIWLNPPKLKQLSAAVQTGGGKVVTTFYDSADNDNREYEISENDIRWAKEVEKIVNVAYSAGQDGRFEESLKYYKKALLKAPGGDLFLMSIGVCYVQLGEKERGIRFLERAARITPKNGRIQRNLEAARGY